MTIPREINLLCV